MNLKDWEQHTKNPEELTEFFRGIRSLYFLMIESPEYGTGCHLVMKMEDGLVIPCWTSEKEARENINKLASDKGRITVRCMAYEELMSTVSLYHDKHGVQRLHLAKRSLAEAEIFGIKTTEE